MSDLEAAKAVLLPTLQIAVPIEILRMRTWDEKTRLAKAAEFGQHIAANGDDILYKTGGETATAFAALARGLAACAYQPGGVTFMGLHWCVNHDECNEASKPALLDGMALHGRYQTALHRAG